MYLNNAAVNAVVRMPQSPVIPPLPDCSLCCLDTALLKHYINCKDAFSGQAGHQLTERENTEVAQCNKNVIDKNATK